MEVKLFSIHVKHNGRFVPMDDIEYTEQEANELLKDLCSNHPGRIFRRHYLRTASMVVLTAARS